MSIMAHVGLYVKLPFPTIKNHLIAYSTNGTHVIRLYVYNMYIILLLLYAQIKYKNTLLIIIIANKVINYDV